MQEAAIPDREWLAATSCWQPMPLSLSRMQSRFRETTHVFYSGSNTHIETATGEGASHSSVSEAISCCLWNLGCYSQQRAAAAICIHGLVDLNMTGVFSI